MVKVQAFFDDLGYAIKPYMNGQGITMPNSKIDTAAIEAIKSLKVLDDGRLEEFIKAAAESGKNIITLLRESNLFSEEQLARVVAVSHKIEFITLSPDMIDPIAAHMISYEISNEHNLIAVKSEGDKLYVAMSSPMNLAVRDQMELRTGYKVVPLAATPNAIKGAIRYHFNVQNVTKQTIASMRLRKQRQGDKQEVTILSKLQESDDPISGLVSSIISGAVDSRASDIHFEPQEKNLIIRYRVDGILKKELEIPVTAQAEVISHLKILAGMDIAEKRIPQDGHITTVHRNREFDLRVSSLPSVTGEKVVIRILDKSNNRWNLDDIAP
ncbi:MAG: ATPase, T2SS/T4P/T4SS family, partial [Phycisphaerae bacterium]|nr:ATPase, T2SS/T4P/T4SS family [Phycisphaerae bacterium]